MNNKGFTLVEVLAVVAIIAILGLIAIPNVLKSIDIGKKASDEVLYNNIKVALQSMYEEKYYNNSSFFKYNNDGKSTDEVNIDSNTDTLVTNIQTLVGYGFLNGVNNNEECLDGSNTCTNKNKKVIYNAMNEDIGTCEVSITKDTSLGKVCYIVSGLSGGNCPTSDDFGGSNQCN